jgi:hypothetical protein
MKLQKRFIITSLLCLLSVCNTVAMVKADQSQHEKWAAMWSWTTASWGENDKSYQQMRTTIDNAIASGRKPQDLVELYAKQARQASNNPEVQFRWAYAAYLTAKQIDYNQGEKVLDGPRISLMAAPFPHSFEYARLVYLTLDYASFFAPFLQEVSKRLVRHSPSDTAVKYAAARNLIYSTNPADRNLAYQYAHELLVTKPDWSSPHGLQGFIYYKRWQTSKSKEVASKSIAEYQQYLRLDTLQDPGFRKQVQETIAEMQKG